MKPQFQHQIVTSFALWLDNAICCRGEAFQNIESTLYYQEDQRLDPNYLAFASPHKQWIYDSSIEGAQVIDGITLDNYFVKKNSQGIQYDFENGRVLLPRSLANPSSYVEALYAVKDFNIYITDQTEEELLIESKFDKNSRYDQDLYEGIKPYDQVVPAIFLSYEYGRNIPFAFGGEDITQSNIRCVVFAENSYQLDGVFSILNDLSTSSVANVGYNEYPLNEFGGLKFGYYDYKDLAERYYNAYNTQSLFHLDKITVSKLNDRVAKKSHPGLYIGFVDFEVRAHRFPRLPLVEPVASREPAFQYIPIAPYELTLITVQEPYAPYDFTLDTGLPFAPYGLFLTKTKHTRLQPGEVASISILKGGKLIVRLDGYAGQIAYLNILGQSIKIGSDKQNNLIWDGYTFKSKNETINVNIAGANFDIKWLGTGSQIIELTRLSADSWNDFEVDVYIPCSKIEINNSGLQTPHLESTEDAEITNNRIPTWSWTAIEGAATYEISDQDNNLTTTEDTVYSPSELLQDGEYSIKVRAIAHDGSKSEWSNTVARVVDSTPPSPAPVLQVHSQPYQDFIDISWEGKARDTNKYVVELIDEVQVNTQIFEEVKTNETKFNKTLRSGRYTINVYSEDLAGNRSLPASYIFRIGMRLDIIRNQVSSDPLITIAALPKTGEQEVRNEKQQTNKYPMPQGELLVLRPSRHDLFLEKMIDSTKDITVYTNKENEYKLAFVQFNTATPYYHTGKYGIYKLEGSLEADERIDTLKLFMLS
jgi:hypothetical protein